MSKQRVLFLNSGNGKIVESLPDEFDVQTERDSLVAVNEAGLKDFDAVIVSRDIDDDTVVAKLCSIFNSLGIPTILIEDSAKPKLNVGNHARLQRTDTFHLPQTLKRA